MTVGTIEAWMIIVINTMKGRDIFWAAPYKSGSFTKKGTNNEKKPRLITSNATVFWNRSIFSYVRVTSFYDLVVMKRNK